MICQKNIHSRPFYLITHELIHYLLIEHVLLQQISNYMNMWNTKTKSVCVCETP